MNKMYTIFLFVLISGCGSSGSGSGADQGSTSPNAVSNGSPGVFIGRVEGIGYQSASHSGTTNSRGEFNYTEGESITFSLGDLVLGECQGKELVTPADFYNYNLPMDSDSLLDELRNKRVTELDYVSNVMTLLVAFDNDQNPYNGLQLLDWETSLDEMEISFHIDMYSFFDRHLLSLLESVNINHSFALGSSLNFLYQETDNDLTLYRATSYELYIDGELQSADESDFRDDGLLIYHAKNPFADGLSIIESYDYDDYGNQTFFETIFDFDRNGVHDKVVTEHGSFNDSGTLTWSSRAVDDDADGKVDDKETLRVEYHENGNLKSHVFEVDRLANDIVDQIETSTFFSDRRQNTYVFENDFDEDGTLDSRTIGTFEYGSDLLLDTVTYEKDSRVDGNIDSISRTALFYKANNNLEQVVFELDDFADDTVDFKEITSYIYNDSGTIENEAFQRFSNGISESYSHENAFTYENGYLATQDLRLDGSPSQGGANSIVDRIQSEVLVFDDNGNLVEHDYRENIQELVNPGAGVGYTYRRTISAAFDDDKLLLSLNSENDGSATAGGADGNADFRYSLAYTYTADGYVETEQFVSDGSSAMGGADGLDDFSQSTVWTYTDDRKLKSMTIEKDANMDGVIDFIYSLELTRDSDGHVLTETKSTDADGNGVPESVSITGKNYDKRYDQQNNLLSLTTYTDIDQDSEYEYNNTENYTYALAGGGTKFLVLKVAGERAKEPATPAVKEFGVQYSQFVPLQLSKQNRAMFPLGNPDYYNR